MAVRPKNVSDIGALCWKNRVGRLEFKEEKKTNKQKQNKKQKENKETRRNTSRSHTLNDRPLF